MVKIIYKHQTPTGYIDIEISELQTFHRYAVRKEITTRSEKKKSLIVVREKNYNYGVKKKLYEINTLFWADVVYTPFNYLNCSVFIVYYSNEKRDIH